MEYFSHSPVAQIRFADIQLPSFTTTTFLSKASCLYQSCALHYHSVVCYHSVVYQENHHRSPHFPPFWSIPASGTTVGSSYLYIFNTHLFIASLSRLLTTSHLLQLFSNGETHPYVHCWIICTIQTTCCPLPQHRSSNILCDLPPVPDTWIKTSAVDTPSCGAGCTDTYFAFHV